MTELAALDEVLYYNYWSGGKHYGERLHQNRNDCHGPRPHDHEGKYPHAGGSSFHHDETELDGQVTRRGENIHRVVELSQESPHGAE